MTVSSDAYGSLPKFDEHGVLTGYEYGKPNSLLRVLKYEGGERGEEERRQGRGEKGEEKGQGKEEERGRGEEKMEGDILTVLYRCLVMEKKIPLPEALAPFTSNAADVLKLKGKKGRIERGGDADVIVLDEEMNIKYVIAKGRGGQESNVHQEGNV